jgi:hypothetical protein
MADEDVSTGESGSETGGSTAPADAGSDQISNPADTDAAKVGTEGDQAPAPEKSEDEMSLTELADKKKADEEKADNDSAKDDKPEEEKPEDKKPEESTEQNEPKSLKEARGHIKSLESQITPLREMESKVLGIGGMPLLEMAQPLLDTALNPEATSGEIIEKLAEVSGRDPQELAWDVVDSNRAAVVSHFCGENMTPEILEKLVEKFEAGEIDLDKAEGEDADDIFLTESEKAVRAREKAASDKEQDAIKAEKAATATRLEGERKTAFTNVATLLQNSVGEAIKDFAPDEKDTPEVKDLKDVLNKSVNAMIAFELSTDPTFQRVQKLIAKNGTKAAEALAHGALARKISDRSAAMMKQLQPLFIAAVGNLQKQATKIKEIREEPDGALGQGDATRKKEISAKDPHWRKDLDAEYEGKIRDLTTKTKRERGQSA